MIGFNQINKFEINSARTFSKRIYDVAVGKLYVFFKSKIPNINFKGK